MLTGRRSGGGGLGQVGTWAHPPLPLGPAFLVVLWFIFSLLRIRVFSQANSNQFACLSRIFQHCWSLSMKIVSFVIFKYVCLIALWNLASSRLVFVTLAWETAQHSKTDWKKSLMSSLFLLLGRVCFFMFICNLCLTGLCVAYQTHENWVRQIAVVLTRYCDIWEATTWWRGMKENGECGENRKVKTEILCTSLRKTGYFSGTYVICCTGQC